MATREYQKMMKRNNVREQGNDDGERMKRNTAMKYFFWTSEAWKKNTFSKTFDTETYVTYVSVIF